MDHLSLGKAGETVAANYLIAQGYRIIDSNFFNKKGYRIGEIDLIAGDKDGRIVFVEVKSRKGKIGEVVPEENVTPAKMRKIYKAINFYLSRNNLFEKEWQLDTISVIFDYSIRRLNIKHIKCIRL